MDETVPQSVDMESFIQSSFSESWSTFAKDAVTYIVAGFVLILLGAVTLGILMGPLTVGFIDIVRKRRRGEEAGIGDIFGGLSKFGSSFVAVVLIALGAIIGFLLLIIPGLIFAFFVTFALQEIAYRDVGAVESITSSIALVKANLVPVLVLMAAVFVISLVGGLVPFGGLLTTPFVTVLMVVGYEKVSGQVPQAAAYTATTQSYDQPTSGFDQPS